MRNRIALVLARADYALSLRVARMAAPYSARARYALRALSGPREPLLAIGAAFWGDVLHGRRPDVAAYMAAAREIE